MASTEKVHGVHQLSSPAGDEEWKIRPGLQTVPEDDPSGQSQACYPGQQLPSSQVCAVLIRTDIKVVALNAEHVHTCVKFESYRKRFFRSGFSFKQSKKHYHFPNVLVNACIGNCDRCNPMKNIINLFQYDKCLFDSKVCVATTDMSLFSNRKSEIEYYAMLAKTGVHHYSGNNIELGTACGKYYRVCTLAIIDPGECLNETSL